jgi:hypothetical protein
MFRLNRSFQPGDKMPLNQLPLFAIVADAAHMTARELMPLIAAEACECGHCHTEHHRDDVETIPHPETDVAESICTDCVAECATCDTRHHPAAEDDGWFYARIRFGYRQTGEACYCADCQFECADCNERFAADLDTYENDDDKRICESCRENYYSCENCSCTIHSDHTFSFPDDDNGTIYCRDCYREEERNREPDDDDSDDSSDESSSSSLHDYSYRPRAIFNRAVGDKSATFYGLELETDHKEARRRRGDDIDDAGIPSLFYAKEDGSLENGFEMVSHPATLKYWQGFDWSFLGKLKSAGYRSYDTTTCGMHVHVSKSALTRLDELKLLEFCKGNAEFILYISRRKRANLDAWSRVCREDRYTLIRKAKGSDIGEHDKRYTAINLVPDKTVEFRIFRGTLDAKSIMRNLAFVATMVQFVKSAGIRSMTFDHYRNWLQVNACKVLGRGELATALVKWVSAFGGTATGAEVTHADAA